MNHRAWFRDSPPVQPRKLDVVFYAAVLRAVRRFEAEGCRRAGLGWEDDGSIINYDI